MAKFFLVPIIIFLIIGGGVSQRDEPIPLTPAPLPDGFRGLDLPNTSQSVLPLQPRNNNFLSSESLVMLPVLYQEDFSLGENYSV